MIIMFGCDGKCLRQVVNEVVLIASCKFHRFIVI